MNLLDYVDDDIKISPELLVLLPFKKLWESNKSKSKAAKEIAYIYFMVNKTNELGFWQEADATVRHKEIKTFIFGKDSKWTASKEVIEAKHFYRNQITPFATGLLEDAIKAANSIREYLRDVDWNLKDKSDKFTYDVNKVKELLLKLPDIDKAITELRNRVKQEESNDADKRGNKKIGMYE